MKLPALVLMSTFLLPAADAAFSDHAVIPLWPEGVPAAVRPDAPAARGPLGPEKLEEGGRLSNISSPTLTVYWPAVDRPNGTAVIICPGGGYGMLSNDREGIQYAQWLSHLGVTSFILKSRLKEYGHPAPLQDVLRAMRLVRSRATEFRINPGRIGVMGSSAGGHLAASAGTLFDHADGRTGAEIDAVNARPDFLILLYPVITLAEGVTHAGSRENLLGRSRTAEQEEFFSLENRVTAATPPTLLIHTQEDKSVPIENSIRFFQALTRAGVPAEFHAFEQGGHGMGMRDGLGTSSDWPDRAREWLRARGLLSPAAKP